MRQTEGPYSLSLNLLRRDIAEEKPGLPLRGRIGVADVNSRALLENAAVDIRRRDARGFYSGVIGEPGGGGPHPAANFLNFPNFRGGGPRRPRGNARLTRSPEWASSLTVAVMASIPTPD